VAQILEERRAILPIAAALRARLQLQNPAIMAKRQRNDCRVCVATEN